MSPEQSIGALTSELLSSFREGYKMKSEDLVRHNAVTNNEINKLALNRQIISGEDGNFSHKIKTKGITNQRSSGRCWMFAGLNMMRPKVIHEQGFDDRCPANADRRIEIMNVHGAGCPFFLGRC